MFWLLIEEYELLSISRKARNDVIMILKRVGGSISLLKPQIISSSLMKILNPILVFIRKKRIGYCLYSEQTKGLKK